MNILLCRMTRMMITIQRIIERRRRARNVRPEKARKRDAKRRNVRRMRARRIAILFSTTKRWSIPAPRRNVDASARRRSKPKRRRNLHPRVSCNLI